MKKHSDLGFDKGLDSGLESCMDFYFVDKVSLPNLNTALLRNGHSHFVKLKNLQLVARLDFVSEKSLVYSWKINVDFALQIGTEGKDYSAEYY